MKRNKIGKLLFIIGICSFTIGVSYLVTKYLDKNLYLDINLEVVFEDTKEFNLESKDVVSESDVLDIYPNKFTVENKSLKGVTYNVLLKEINSEKNTSREKLAYILYLNDKEVLKGSLKDIDEKLYTNNIGMLKKDYYKLYIYLKDEEIEPNFDYELEITKE